MTILDIFLPRRVKMGRWEIVKQESGITGPMIMNILSTISTAIDTHGSSNMHKIALDVSNWLDHTYGKKWAVSIYECGQGAFVTTYYEKKFLRVKETNLDWYITILQATP